MFGILDVYKVVDIWWVESAEKKKMIEFYDKLDIWKCLHEPLKMLAKIKNFYGYILRLFYALILLHTVIVLDTIFTNSTSFLL